MTATGPNPGEGAAPTLRATGLSKRYGRDRLALDGVDLAVPAGSIAALVGPNGAGKTTLIRTWLGFERPDAGSVEVMGIDPSRRPDLAHAQVGYVPQQSFLYRELSIGQHLDLAGSLRPSFDRHLAEARLGELGLAPGRRVERLSGGEQAQVALTLALATRAPVLLLDEPLASLDPLARREFLRLLLSAVRPAGQTVLLSSHVVGDLEPVVDRLVVLGAGRVLLSSSIVEALAGHRVAPAGSEPGPAPQGAIGTFPALAGPSLTLWRGDGGAAADRSAADSQGTQRAPALRPATLEEVVLGYLAGATPVRGPSAAAA